MNTITQNVMSTERKPVLEAVGLTKRYEDGVLALDHVSFKVHRGKIFAMLGGNGAGKTTTINLFLNFIEPSDGEARINGIVSHKEPLEAKKYVSYVSENVMLYQNFTAIQNLDFFSRIAGKTEYSRNDYEEALLKVGLSRKAHNKKLREFSKGMRQKCGIAIAMMKDAPAVLLDEPTSGLDPKAGREFMTLLDSLRSAGKAVLMSTHDIFRAKEIADHIAIMDRGNIVMHQEAASLAEENLEEIYLSYMSGKQLSAAM